MHDSAKAQSFATRSPSCPNACSPVRRQAIATEVPLVDTIVGWAVPAPADGLPAQDSHVGVAPARASRHSMLGWAVAPALYR